MKDCAANGEIPSFGQLEDSFGLSGVVSLYFFSVFFFLATLALLLLSLARLYQNVGRAEVSCPGQSTRVLSWGWAPGLLGLPDPLCAQCAVSLPDVGGVGSPGEAGTTSDQDYRLLPTRPTSSFTTWSRFTRQLWYTGWTTETISAKFSTSSNSLNILDLQSNLLIGLEEKLKFWQ